MKMTLAGERLWERIEAFAIDDGAAALPFAARLAVENSWPRDYADRVIAEYKRFLYLAMTAGHMVTPSKHVDEAWHLHLTYTRSYWDRLCGEVLGRPLHHEPTRGGEEEDAKFAGLYLRTLESYERAFGEAPPADIWPRPCDGAGRKRSLFRFPRLRDVAVVAVMVAVFMLSAAAEPRATSIVAAGIAYDLWTGLIAMIGCPGLIFAALFLIALVSHRSGRKRKGGGGWTCSVGCAGAGCGSSCGSGCGGGCGGS